MLTGHDSDSDTVQGLDAGANDYVTNLSASRSSGADAGASAPARGLGRRAVSNRPICFPAELKTSHQRKRQQTAAHEKETASCGFSIAPAAPS